MVSLHAALSFLYPEAIVRDPPVAARRSFVTVHKDSLDEIKVTIGDGPPAISYTYVSWKETLFIDQQRFDATQAGFVLMSDFQQ